MVLSVHHDCVPKYLFTVLEVAKRGLNLKILS